MFLLLAGLQSVAGNEVNFVAAAPDVVVSGDQFRLTFTVNTQKVKDFRAPSIKGFEVLMGPSRSSQNSTQIINGKVSSSSSITYTYILMAGKEGTYNIPAASIVADGETKISNSLQIKVLPADDASASSAQGGSASSSRSQAVGSKITDKDLFITASASKTKVYEQEAILLTYKVYTVVDLRQLYGDMPDLKGFHTQEVELPVQKTFSLEHYNGRNYNTTVWRQYVLFPQQSGTMEIPSITFDGVVAQRINNGDPFDAFFNGGTNYVEIKKKIVTPKLKINVAALPSKPADFSGAVGTFTMASSINSKSVKTNDAVTIKLTVTGTGNMKLIGTPEVKFPQDFEVYDPKIDNQFNLTREGVSGSKTYEYLAIPRHAGKFTIPAVSFTYFDLKTKTYKTLKSEEYVINVEKGQGNADQVIADFTNKESVKMLGNDVRYIKRGATQFAQRGDYFYGTTAYWMWYIIPFVLFVGVILMYRKQAMDNANTAKMKTKKANKVAVKRMKLAGKLLSENKKNEFYDEVLKALWGYISDKLSIPVSQLSKDNIEQELSRYGVNEELVKAFINVLNDCEFARYAPGDENEAMDKVYTASIELSAKWKIVSNIKNRSA